MSFEVSAAAWALVEEAKKTLRAQHGGSVSDDVVMATLARALLDGSGARDAGQASYQIGLIVCDQCKTATLRAGGDEVVVDETTVERAECDAQHLGSSGTHRRWSIGPSPTWVATRRRARRWGPPCAKQRCRAG